jgi:predicted secreted Zn-dependent protease
MRLYKILATLAITALAGCTSTSQRTNVSVDYYNVKGTSFEQLDKQIALHGPNVKGVGKAVASASIRMLPDIRFRTIGGKCRVAYSRINVKANLTLPRLSDRNKAAKELRPAFSNIENYAKLHEAVHVKIADTYAAKAEKAIKALPPENTCERLQSKAVSTFEAIMVEHRKAQLKFDADEQKRFARQS